MEDAIRYTVTIKATVERKEMVGKEWTTVAHEAQDGSDKTKPVYGYTPEIEKTVRRDIQIFEQTVDSFNVAALVSVVNGLPTNAELRRG